MTKLVLISILLVQTLAFAKQVCPPGSEDPLIPKIINANQVLKVGKPRNEAPGSSCTLQIFAPDQLADNSDVSVQSIRHTFSLEDIKFAVDFYYPYGCWRIDYAGSKLIASDEKMETAALYQFNPQTLEIENFTYKDPGMGKLTCEFK